MTISLKSIQYFLALASAKSISQAAKDLHIAQPALSLRIKTLESDLGATLFKRHSGGIELTYSGQRFLKHAQELTDKLSFALADMKEPIVRPTGIIKIGLPQSIAALLTVPLLTHSLENWPDLQLQIIDLSTGYIPGFVSSGHVDLGITFAIEDSPALHFEHVVDEQLVLISLPPDAPADSAHCSEMSYQKLQAIKFRELEALPLILPMQTHTLRKILDAYQASEKVRFQIRAEANSVSQLIEIVAAGLSHSILSFPSVRNDVASGRIAAKRIIAPDISRPVYLCSSKTHMLSFSQMAVGEQILKLLRQS